MPRSLSMRLILRASKRTLSTRYWCQPTTTESQAHWTLQHVAPSSQYQPCSAPWCWSPRRPCAGLRHACEQPRRRAARISVSITWCETGPGGTCTRTTPDTRVALPRSNLHEGETERHSELNNNYTDTCWVSNVPGCWWVLTIVSYLLYGCPVNN